MEYSLLNQKQVLTWEDKSWHRNINRTAENSQIFFYKKQKGWRGGKVLDMTWLSVRDNVRCVSAEHETDFKVVVVVVIVVVSTFPFGSPNKKLSPPGVIESFSWYT